MAKVLQNDSQSLFFEDISCDTKKVKMYPTLLPLKKKKKEKKDRSCVDLAKQHNMHWMTTYNWA